MISQLKAWRRTRRDLRRENKLNDPMTYPADMRRDVVETICAVRKNTMTSVERIHGLCEAIRYVSENRIDGDIVECGVWKGGSMMAVAHMLGRLRDTDRDLYLCDTFEGMSEPTEADVSVKGESAESLLQVEDREDSRSVWCVAALDEVRENLETTHYPRERVHLVPGKVEDTLPAAAPDRIALLRLDTDWYESTKHELEHLFPRLVDGGVLIIDDYGHWQGARKAVDEYFAEHGIAMLLHRLDYTGRMGIRHFATDASVQVVSKTDVLADNQGVHSEAA